MQQLTILFFLCAAEIEICEPVRGGRKLSCGKAAFFYHALCIASGLVFLCKNIV
jgi:hypothetical protein